MKQGSDECFYCLIIIITMHGILSILSYAKVYAKWCDCM